MMIYAKHLFFLLWSFCCCFSSARVESPAFVACGVTGEPPSSSRVRWAKQSKGEFAITERNESTAGACTPKEVLGYCRSQFDYISHVSNLSETYTLTESGMAQNTTVTTVMRKFECQAYIPLKQRNYPKHLWSDHLRVSGDSECLSRKQWLQAAKAECGEEPLHCTMGSSCSDAHNYVEMVFVCALPRNSLPSDLNADISSAEEYFTEWGLGYFNDVAEIANKVLEMKKRNATRDEIEAVEWKMIYLFFGEYLVMMNSTLHSSGTVASSQIQRQQSYVSRCEILSNVHIAIQKDNQNKIGRPIMLSLLAFGFLFNENNKKLSTYNLQELDKYDVNGVMLKELLKEAVAFPELETEITRAYVDNLKKHTIAVKPEYLDFMEKPGAHKKKDGFVYFGAGTILAVFVLVAVGMCVTIKLKNWVGTPQAFHKQPEKKTDICHV